jgi:hypothetical protein
VRNGFQKTDTVALSDVQRWMASNDIEILGFTYRVISNGRFRIEPPISLSEYVEFIKRYYERCLRENPNGEWSDSKSQLPIMPAGSTGRCNTF